MPFITLDDLFRSRDPPYSCARRKDFREGIHTHYAAVDVHAQERGDEGFDEFFVGSGGRDVRGVGPGVGLHLQEIVGFVFEDVQIVFLTTAVELPAALCALSCACGVLPAGNGVQKEGFLGTSGLLIPVAEDVVKACGK